MALEFILRGHASYSGGLEYFMQVLTLTLLFNSHISLFCAGFTSFSRIRARLAADGFLHSFSGD